MPKSAEILSRATVMTVSSRLRQH